ncbi:aminopeptidase N [Leeia sp. TBRC 13508]|uniref:Aminopeptidase N n=1 Tax=Leeia speluncae TaxID=2884804 RepID=A0ABS8DB43_9NEIS|nr:aminopeptidase N [Leeia speluncae]MCB6185342.1 aminopeptidase N [Leeia speluncae]
MRHNEAPKTIYLKDYLPSPFLIDRVDLKFDLQDDHTIVSARMMMSRNSVSADKQGALQLVGDGLTLVSVKIDGDTWPEDKVESSADHLTIHDVPESFFLDLETRIEPHKNTALSGLYKSGHNYYTQCEAEGFRRIMYYLDRPDVMARFSTTIIADKQLYPVLLSNGNQVGQGDSGKGRHWVKWVDPFRKPAYLFALVAGRLVKLEDRFVTRSGRAVTLQIWVEAGNLDQCPHAMQSLKNAMRWDEERFGLEYDLDIYMIVAVSDFTMGAMENKGLNIFNTKYVLAKQETATDVDFAGIESVIGHEYFHNWTGNRVTCRDWFQLSLKEGLTVFRDQEFSMDLGSRAVERIDQVRTLRTHQFPEDAGPMAHPIRPDSYIEINNFYTVTVYEKGAEVIRMQHTLLGEEGFQKGMDLYFHRHDGQAVTTEDFVAAMQDANGVDLSQFKHWYSQAGTPVLQVNDAYNATAGEYTLTFTQTCPATPGQTEKQPFHIPVKMGLLDAAGQVLPLQLKGSSSEATDELVLSITEASQSFVFTGLAAKPIPSLLRGYSAPVKLQYAYQPSELAFLLANDVDAFNRWDAGQQLAEKVLLGLVDSIAAGQPLVLDAALVNAFGKVLADRELDPALAAQILTLPSETWLAEVMDVANPDAIHQARQFVRRALAAELQPLLSERYQELTQTKYVWNGEASAKRALRNVCLAYLVETLGEAGLQLAKTQFDTADNMTDQQASLAVLVQYDHPLAEEALAVFYERYKGYPLVMDKWFALQSTSCKPNTLEKVRSLLTHPAFTLTNPNKVYSLIRSFSAANPVHFHAASGEGYAFIADQVIALNDINPQVASRVASAFNRWKKYDSARQGLMKAALSRVAAHPGLSSDVYEIVTKALNS